MVSGDDQKIQFKTTLILKQNTNEEETNSGNKITSLHCIRYTIPEIKVTVNGSYFNSQIKAPLSEFSMFDLNIYYTLLLNFS